MTIRYDHFSFNKVDWEKVEGLVISPGPGVPSDYPIHFKLYDRFVGRKPILGVCLGFQSLGQYFGAKLVKAQKPMHGKVSSITHTGCGIFKGLSSPTKVTRYHSLILTQLPKQLISTAQTNIGETMAFKHESLFIEGVQFHPEAHLTEHGVQMVLNWLDLVKNSKAAINKEEINVL